ncbi:hypothetical protein C7212DRAFT_53567, partial [Tuber magnatum]
NVWNMDKLGIALGVCGNSMILSGSRKPKTYKQVPENQRWVSAIESICTMGYYIHLLVLFKDKQVQILWFIANNISDWLIMTTLKGWTLNVMALRWLNEVCLPET